MIFPLSHRERGNEGERPEIVLNQIIKLTAMPPHPQMGGKVIE